MSSGTIGKLAAAIIFTGLVGLVLYGLSQSQPTQRPTGPEGVDSPTPDARRTGGLLGGVESSVFQSFDPETGTLRYQFEWDTLDPVGQGRYEVVAPVATFFQDGRRIEVRAREGRLLWPSRDREPESGNLSGDVVVTIHETGDAVEGRVVGTMTTPSLFFQSVLGELNAPELVEITAPGVEFSGRGLTARISEVQRRLQYLRVNEHLGTTIWPDRLGESADEDGRATRRERAARDGTPADGAGAEPLIDLYRVTFSRAVRLSRGGQTATADEAEVWLRLRDRRLSRDAIAPLTVGPVTRGSSGDRPRPVEGAPVETADERASAEEAPIRFENTGPIEIVPLLQPPTQLASDDLTARFRASESTAVVLRDEESGSSIRCGSLQWGFTSRQLAVRGVGGMLGVEFDFPGEASVRTGAVDVDLGLGIAAFPGAGRVTLEPGVTGQERSTSIAWTERADVMLDTASSAARTSRNPLLRWLTASGGIVASTDTATVSGDFIRADFSSRIVGDEVRNDLGRVSVRDRARAVIRDGDVDADVSGNRLDVLFVSTPGGPGQADRLVPTRASASGNAVAMVNGDRLAAGTIDAVIVSQGGERTRMQSLDASGDVTLRTRDGVDLASSTLHASEQTGTMTLVGYPATVGLYETQDRRGATAADEFAQGFSITGESIRFDREPRVLTVFGGGVLSYAAMNAETGLYDNGSVHWQRSMRFDDRAGHAEFVGGVSVRASSSPGDEYSMEGDRVELTLVADLLDEQARRSISDGEDATSALIAVRVEAVPGRQARAEARSYSGTRGDAERTLLTAARLSGEQIIARRDIDRLDVPGAGRLVIEDRRETEEPRGGAGESPLLTDGRGTTIFDWTGAMEASQRERVGSMIGGVRMRHLHLGSSALTVVETERLTATLGETSGEGAGGEGGGADYVLEGVEAEGAVLATHLESQVVADRLSYSRAASRVIASAMPGNRVTFYDAESGRHIPAERVVLDLLTGRWRIEQAGQITTPLIAPGR